MSNLEGMPKKQMAYVYNKRGKTSLDQQIQIKGVTINSS